MKAFYDMLCDDDSVVVAAVVVTSEKHSDSINFVCVLPAEIWKPMATTGNEHWMFQIWKCRKIENVKDKRKK